VEGNGGLDEEEKGEEHGQHAARFAVGGHVVLE
jgi:hypothetical protein